MTDKYLKGIPDGSRATISNSPLRKSEVNEQNIKVIQELNEHAKQRDKLWLKWLCHGF